MFCLKIPGVVTTNMAVKISRSVIQNIHNHSYIISWNGCWKYPLWCHKHSNKMSQQPLKWTDWSVGLSGHDPWSLPSCPAVTRLANLPTSRSGKPGQQLGLCYIILNVSNQRDVRRLTQANSEFHLLAFQEKIKSEEGSLLKVPKHNISAWVIMDGFSSGMVFIQRGNL